MKSKIFLIIYIYLFLASSLLFSAAGADESQADRKTSGPHFADAVEEARRRMAVVETVCKDMGVVTTVATGVFFGKDGGVITSIAAIAGSEKVFVKKLDKERHRASVKAVDQALGFVFLETPIVFESPFKDSDSAPRVGEWALLTFAVDVDEEERGDYEMGLFPTVVASVDARLSFAGELYGPMLKLSSKAPAGSATAPAFNSRGQLEGILLAVRDCSEATECTYILGIDEVNEVVANLKKGDSNRLGWIGAAIRKLPDKPGGLKIAAVMQGCPAEKAGLKAGDILLAINGQRVNTTSAFKSCITNVSPGDTVELEIERDGERKDITLKAEPRPFTISTHCEGERSK